MTDKHKKAEEMTAKLHALLHTAEGTKGEITYLDIARICDYLKDTYFPDGLPSGLRTAFDTAIQTCRPSTLEGINQRNRVCGVLFWIPGGLFAVSGFGSIKNAGVVIKHPIVEDRWVGRRVWDWFFGNQPHTPAPDEVNWGAIASTVVGIILISIGIYMVRRRANPKYQASEAEAIIQYAIEQWANPPLGIEGNSAVSIE